MVFLVGTKKPVDVLLIERTNRQYKKVHATGSFHHHHTARRSSGVYSASWRGECHESSWDSLEGGIAVVVPMCGASIRYPQTVNRRQWDQRSRGDSAAGFSGTKQSSQSSVTWYVRW